MEKILTIRELIDFFETNKIQSFSAEKGKTIHVLIPSTFQIAESGPTDGLMRLRIRLLHSGKNANDSFVSLESIQEALPSFKNRPILAYIHQKDDGEWDFEGHNMSLEKNEDGETEIVYQERQIGSITEDEPFFEEDDDKTYVCVYGVIPTEYSRAADILQRKGWTKNSAELSIQELEYDRDHKCLNLKKWTLSATTLLGAYDDGTEVQEGMKGSRAEIVDFNFNNNDDVVIKEGGETSVNKFQELLEQYGVKPEDIKFEYDGLSDEELEAKFAEAFTDAEPAEEAGDPDEAEDGDEDHSAENNTTFSFTLTLGEVDAAVNRALRASYEDDDVRVFGEPFVDNTVVIHIYDYSQDPESARHYKQGYAVSEDGTATLLGEKVEVFPRWLTKEEADALDELKTRYDDVVSQLNVYRKNELWNSDEYSSIANSEKYSALKDGSEGMTFEEVKDRLEAILLEETKKANSNFAAKNREGVVVKPLVKAPEKKKSRYGNLIRHTED